MWDFNSQVIRRLISVVALRTALCCAFKANLYHVTLALATVTAFNPR